jgi:hypothetical protein
MTTFKVLNISDPGSSTRYGGDDLDKITKYLNGTNIIDPVGPIDTETIFKSNKLILRDLSNQVNIHIITSTETISSSITIPPLNGNVTMLLDNDTRLYNTRDPNTHSVSHQVGQPDVIPIDQLGLPTDVTNTQLNATTLVHGLMPPLPADGLAYLDGNGNWTYPSGTGVLPDGSLTNAKLADETITADKIAPATITNSEVAPSAAITYSKLALTGAILNADINTSAAIAWSKISKVGSKLEDMADVNITGRGDQMLLKWDTATSKYVFYTPSAGSGAVIPDDNSVSTIKIQNLAVTTAKIADANVTTAKIANLAITTALITDANVTLAKLASNSVDSSKIVDGSILNADINTAAAIAWTKISKSGSVLSDMGNVATTTPTDGYVLTYVTSTGKWTPAVLPTPSSSGDSANPMNGVATGWIIGGPGSLNDQEIGGGLLEHTQAINICNADQDADGSYMSLTTTSTSQTNAQFSSKDDTAPFYVALNPKLYVKFKMPNAGNIRMFIGFTDLTPVSTVTYNSLDNRKGMGIRFDTTNDTKFVVLNNNGGSSATATVTGVTPSSGHVYTLSIECVSSGTWALKLDGSTLRSTSTNVPTSTGLGWGAMVNTHTSAVRNLDIYYVYCSQVG